LLQVRVVSGTSHAPQRPSAHCSMPAPQASLHGREVGGTSHACQLPPRHSCTPTPQTPVQPRVAPGSLHASPIGRALRAPQLATTATSAENTAARALPEGTM
jgi:hypothetical protein